MKWKPRYGGTFFQESCQIPLGYDFINGFAKPSFLTKLGKETNVRSKTVGRLPVFPEFFFIFLHFDDKNGRFDMIFAYVQKTT